MIKTIIASSIHRAKQLERLGSNPLSRSMTLDNFIQAYYERYGAERLIGVEESLAIMAGLFIAQQREHFDYVTAESDAMEQIAAFIIDIKRNMNGIEDFNFVPAKHRELLDLYTGYNDFLKNHRLKDRAGMEVFVLEFVKNDPASLKVFGEIIVDDFKQNGIHFETSKIQASLLDVLSEIGKTAGKESAEVQCPVFYEPFPRPFDIFDEVAAAIKISRKLLDEGENPDEILIVTPTIDEYAPIFESLFDAYGIKGYTSIGTSLNSLLPMLKKGEESEDELLIMAANRKQQIKADIEKTAKHLSSMGLEYNTAKAFEKAVSKARIKPRIKEGVLITEPNQLLSVDRVKHLIFVGTDMGHFPPSSQESFLASTAQKEALLHANSVYLSSYNHYLQMKAVAENLYIVTASYKGKTKLARSNIITEKCEPYDVSRVLASFELPRYGKRLDDPQIDPYVQMTKQEHSPYDGFHAGGYDAKTLSASQLGSYAMCPRRYFFDRVLSITAPDKPEEGLEANDKGKIMHKCFELFAIDAKKGVISVGAELDDAMKRHMLVTAQKAYEWFMRENEIVETINHKLYFQELVRGLKEGDETSGVLSNFLDFITKNHASLSGFKDSEFEMEFRLDTSFNLVGTEKPYFIKGYIDRIDIKDDEVRIIDYKSKKAKGIDKDKMKQIIEFKDMQLALYVLFARKAYGDKPVESYLQSFNSYKGHAEFAKVATYEAGKEGEYVHYDEEFEKRLISRIFEIQQSIDEGDFHYDDSDEKQCEYCDFSLICN